MFAYASTHIVSTESAQTLDTEDAWEALAGTYVNGSYENTDGAPSSGGITVKVTGIYEVQWHVSAACESGTFEFAVAVDGTVDTKLKATQGSARNDDDVPFCVGNRAYISLTAGEVLGLRARCTSNDSRAITVFDASLSLSAVFQA